MDPCSHRQSCVLQALGPHKNQKDRTALFLCGRLTGGNALVVQAVHTRQEQKPMLDMRKFLTEAHHSSAYFRAPKIL